MSQYLRARQSLVAFLLVCTSASPSDARPAQAAGAAEQGPLDAAVRTITEAELSRHIGILAADSLHGRVTPSPGLEVAARYVADEFQRLGLQAGRGWAGDPTWFERYPLPRGRRMLDTQSSRLAFSAVIRAGEPQKDVLNEAGWPSQRTARVTLATFARLTGDSLAESEFTPGEQPKRVQVVTGRQTIGELQHGDWAGSLLVYVPPIGLDSAAQAAVVANLTASANVVVLAPEDSAAFAQRTAAREVPTVVFDRYIERMTGGKHWVVDVYPAAVAPVLAVTGLDLKALQHDTTPRVRDVPVLTASPWLIFMASSDTATAVNVVGKVEGSDSTCSSGRLVYTAHLDGAGTGLGTNDNATGVAALLALAKAFGQPGARPRCTVLFVATSGEYEHLAGANYFAHSLDDEVVNITLDMIGRNPGDTLPVVGLRDFVFSQPPDWLATIHPDLGLTIVDGGTVAAMPSSDHYAFVDRGIPSLRLSTGYHDAMADTGSPGEDTPASIDLNYAARVARFAFWLGEDLANDPGHLPQWTSAGRRRLLGR